MVARPHKCNRPWRLQLRDLADRPRVGGQDPALQEYIGKEPVVVLASVHEEMKASWGRAP